MDLLVQRLVDDPHDDEALSHAHRAGTEDPQLYATMLPCQYHVHSCELHSAPQFV